LGKPAKHEISAGGIIYRNRAGQIEVFFIKDPFGRWTFPKGHQEIGETLAETAVREIKEETNLDNLRLVAPLGKTSFRFKREEGVIEKTVYVFLFEAPLSAKAQVIGEGAIWEGTWLRSHKVFSISGYRNLDKILAKAMRIITEQEGMKPEHPIQRAQKGTIRVTKRRRKSRGPDRRREKK
jgi:8-oxo-dGTP pyrophosphatase MutT (NUDIX family)